MAENKVEIEFTGSDEISNIIDNILEKLGLLEDLDVFKGVESQTDTFIDSMENIEGSVDNVASSLDDIGSAAENLVGSEEDAVSSTQDMADELDNVKSSANTASSNITALSTDLLDLTTSVAGMVGVGLTLSSAFDVSDVRTELRNIADTVGLTTDELNNMKSSMSDVQGSIIPGVNGVATAWLNVSRTVGMSSATTVTLGKNMEVLAVNASNLGQDGAAAVQRLGTAFQRWNTGTKIQGRALGGLAVATGLTIDQITDLQDVALEFGTESPEFVSAIQSMTDGMDIDKPKSFGQIISGLANTLKAALGDIADAVMPAIRAIDSALSWTWQAIDKTCGEGAAKQLVSVIVGVLLVVTTLLTLKKTYGTVKKVIDGVKSAGEAASKSTTGVSKSGGFFTKLGDSLKNLSNNFKSILKGMVQAAIIIAVGIALITLILLEIAGAVALFGAVTEPLQPYFAKAQVSAEGMIAAITPLIPVLIVLIAAITILGHINGSIGEMLAGAVGVAIMIGLLTILLIEIGAALALFGMVTTPMQEPIMMAAVSAEMINNSLTAVVPALMNLIVVLGLLTILGPLLLTGSVGVLIVAAALPILSGALFLFGLSVTLLATPAGILPEGAAIIMSLIPILDIVANGLQSLTNSTMSIAVTGMVLLAATAGVYISTGAVLAAGIALALLGSALAGLNLVTLDGDSSMKLAGKVDKAQKGIDKLQESINNLKTVDSSKIGGIIESIKTAATELTNLKTALTTANNTVGSIEYGVFNDFLSGINRFSHPITGNDPSYNLLNTVGLSSNPIQNDSQEKNQKIDMNITLKNSINIEGSENIDKTQINQIARDLFKKEFTTALKSNKFKKIIDTILFKFK
jgi:methyl-accepting chemotaxis protein